MFSLRLAALAMSAGAALCGLPNGAAAVTITTATVNGFASDVFTWTDSAGLRRSMAMKKQGAGNAGNGGYAIRMTYRIRKADGSIVTVTANAPTNDGFGYFVSHERYRLFSDGSESPIAQKIFGKDDSPLGRGFPVVTKFGATSPARKSIKYKLIYPRYGTKAANGIDPETGQDSPPLGTSKSLYALYDLPVLTEWIFQDGRDYPRILTVVSTALIPGVDRTSFDLRGPYGKLDFDGGGNPLTSVTWGDRFLFASSGATLTRNSAWTWSTRNGGARFIGIVAGGREMGLIEPRPYATSRTNDGYSEARGRTSATYNGGRGCPFQDQKLPCDYEWPYQGPNYELPYDNPNGSTTSEKIAWGSTPFYGTSLSSTWDGGAATPFDGFPATRRLIYDVCVVMGETVAGGLTRSVAAAGGTYSCASAE